MRKEYHQIPILQLDGKNLEEKETRHDLDTKLSADKDVKNDHVNNSLV